MQASLARWGTALLPVAAVVGFIATFLLNPFVEETASNEIQQTLLDMDSDSTQILTVAAFQMFAGAFVIAAAALVAGRTLEARGFSLASVAFAVVTGSALVGAAALKVGLLEAAEAVADGDTSSSTLVLGRALGEATNVLAAAGMIAMGVWVGLAAAAIARTGAFSRGVAYVGLGACGFMLLSLLGNTGVEALYGFSVIGWLLMLVWAVWMAVATIRGGEAQPDLSSRRSVPSPA
jgi:hypothetical protein